MKTITRPADEMKATWQDSRTVQPSPDEGGKLVMLTEEDALVPLTVAVYLQLRYENYPMVMNSKAWIYAPEI